uniref:Uncharacterized protein n=1 Tax=Populus trichocarpa TaxID=3694 RepID=U5GV24_POPTR
MNNQHNYAHNNILHLTMHIDACLQFNVLHSWLKATPCEHPQPASPFHVISTNFVKIGKTINNFSNCH